ncbi:MAG: zinc dependent phospholipase C family protein [Bacteroidetes bacterium]|nr:zinc dependent phospholipase C family protein [Bacteroidota bacterium]
MKKIVLNFCVVTFSVFLISWGAFGHEHINRAAVFALPVPMQSFFYNHIDFVTQEASVPDLRKYTLNDKAENPRHFIDLENFGSLDSIPKTMEEAKKKYDDKFLSQNGILYWYVQDLMEKLTKSFKEKKKTEILFLAADLGHYIGDAHMPLHTSANYDGQQTNQKGIHSLWESRLPEMFGAAYNYNTMEAKYIENVQAEFWKIILNSNKLKDTLLSIDRDLKKKFTEDKIYKTDAAGKVIKNKFGQSVFSDDYATAFHTALNGMVEKQMHASVQATADFWYTAWVNAGKPDLNSLDPSDLTKRNSKSLKQDLKLWKKGKLFGVESEKEF